MNDFLGPLDLYLDGRKIPRQSGAEIVHRRDRSVQLEFHSCDDCAGAFAIPRRVLPCSEVLHRRHIHRRHEGLMAELQLQVRRKGLWQRIQSGAWH